jgi:hypothetical protein
MTSISPSNSPTTPLDSDKVSLRASLAEHRDRYARHTTNWWRAYHGCLSASIVLSASAATVLKLEIVSDAAIKSDIAAGLATLAAILTTATAAMNFQGRWQVNRKARYEIEALQIALDASDADVKQIREDFKKVVAKRIAGDGG